MERIGASEAEVVMKLVLSPGRISRLLLALVFLLTLLSMVGQYCKFALHHDHVGGLVPLFYLGAEGNIPTWFSTTLALFCALLLALIAAAKQGQPGSYAGHWKGLALIFLYISLDDTSHLHEMTEQPLRQALSLSGPFYYAWVVPFTALVVLFGLFYVKFLWHLPTDSRRRFVLAGGLFVGGALGLEFLEGQRAEMHGWDSLSVMLLSSLQEFLEMLGLVLFARALLLYLEAEVKRVEIGFAEQGGRAGIPAANQTQQDATEVSSCDTEFL